MLTKVESKGAQEAVIDQKSITTGSIINMPKADAVYIKWADSKAYPWDEYEADDVEGYFQMESVGFIVQEDKEKITLALDKTSNGMFRFILTIPQIAITHRKNLYLKLSENETI